jgi:uncharacterized protein YbjT (DUF2867 family)
MTTTNTTTSSIARTATSPGAVLVLGGTGKTGRRIAERLTALGVTVRVGSRSARPAFDWAEPATWAGALQGMDAAYVVYHSDLAFPGAADQIRAFARQAVDSGVRRLVLLSGRGEEGARLSEAAARESGADLTVVRASWFAQNFSEGFLQDAVMTGALALPSAANPDIKEPFVDVDDVAEVAVASLMDPRHIGATHELTGPRLLTFAEAANEIAAVTGRPIQYLPLTVEDWRAAASSSLPPGYLDPLTELLTSILDGHNGYLDDGVARVLGRPARDFGDYVRQAAATGVWAAQAA